MAEQVRVRFAPSPTGKVHIGNIRAAIFNWLFARHVGGEFLLRVEDTDLERSTPEAIPALLDCMKWLGLDWDGEILYQTSQRKHHLEVAEDLLRRGLAYKENKGGQGECVIFRMPKEGVIEYDDLVKGHMKKKAKDTQDFVIVRSDGSPVFHLANVLDDITQGVTHIIRGDDHVENTFKHIQLFKALGAPIPRYAHLPMIVNNQGKPYSKRDGSAFVGEFRELGFLPDALFNFLALLGWAPGDDREILSMEELISLFDLHRCSKSGAKFDYEKGKWFNHQYIQQRSDREIAEMYLPLLREKHHDCEIEKLTRIVGLVKSRISFVNELWEQTAFFFEAPTEYEEKSVRKRWDEGMGARMAELIEILRSLPTMESHAAEEVVLGWITQKGYHMGNVMNAFRLAVVGYCKGPHMFDITEIMGREETIQRIEKAIERLG